MKLTEATHKLSVVLDNVKTLHNEVGSTLQEEACLRTFDRDQMQEIFNLLEVFMKVAALADFC